MDNNDRLIRIRYALDIKITDMISIFHLGGLDFTKEEINRLLIKTLVAEEESVFFKYVDEDQTDSKESEQTDQIKCSEAILDTFLNGFIIFKRGKQKPKDGQSKTIEPPKLTVHNVNNMMLKKLKIALTLSSDDVIALINSAGGNISKSELGAILRREDHQKYMKCMDKYARNFLQGLTNRYRQNEEN